MRQGGERARKDGRNLEARGGAQKDAGKRDADLRSGNQRFRLVDEPKELLRARVAALREMLHPAFPAFEKRRLDLCEERAEKNASDEQQA